MESSWRWLTFATALTAAALVGCGDDDGGDGSGGNGGDGSGNAGTAGSGNAGNAGAGNTGNAGTGNTGNGGPDPLGMVAAHNQVRQNATPTPDPPLPDLVWDEGLAASAQAWADGCQFEHSGPGENLYASSAAQDASAVVGSWASEASSYDYASNSCSGVCGHYTQIVWRDTERVGCAFADCANLPELGGAAQMWVCQYDPPGNFIGEKPY